MLRNATCLLIQDEENYYLTPYTNEREESGSTIFEPNGTLTAITIWPHKDEKNPLDDVKKQLCLKFIELKHKKYSSDLRSTSTVKTLMEQLDETQKTFVNAVTAAFEKTDNTKWVHKGRSFSTDIVQINLKDVATPKGFFKADKKHVDKIAFQHACLESLKASAGLPAMKTLDADVTSGEIVGTEKLFHPFALQLNNTVYAREAEANVFAADDSEKFKLAYQTAKQSPTQFSKAVLDEKIQKIYAPMKKALEEKLGKAGSSISMMIKEKQGQVSP